MFWDRYQSWDEAEAAWDAAARQAAAEFPLKTAANPSSPAIVPGETHLRWRGLWWVIKKDTRFQLIRRLLRHPFRYALGYLRSAIGGPPFRQDGDLFFYGIDGLDAMKRLIREKETVLLVGFSYCQKPHECPCGRFSDGCIHSLDSLVCRQCVIGKAAHALPSAQTIFVIIPTINAIGAAVLEAAQSNKQVAFIITSCTLALEMFSDMGNMAGVRGVGIRLGGRVCNTFRAFELSEEGVKSGATTLLPSAQRFLFDLLRTWREAKQPQER